MRHEFPKAMRIPGRGTIRQPRGVGNDARPAQVLFVSVRLSPVSWHSAVAVWAPYPTPVNPNRMRIRRIHAVETNPDRLPFAKGEGTFGGTRVRAPNMDPRQVRSSSPLPARSGERIKVRGPSDCILADKAARSNVQSAKP